MKQASEEIYGYISIYIYMVYIYILNILGISWNMYIYIYSYFFKDVLEVLIAKFDKTLANHR